MKCPVCGAEIVEGDVRTPYGFRKGLIVKQEIGKPLCNECLKRLM